MENMQGQAGTPTGVAHHQFNVQATPNLALGPARQHPQCPNCTCNEQHPGCLACYKRRIFPGLVHSDCPSCFCFPPGNPIVDHQDIGHRVNPPPEGNNGETAGTNAYNTRPNLLNTAASPQPQGTNANDPRPNAQNDEEQPSLEELFRKYPYSVLSIRRYLKERIAHDSGYITDGERADLIKYAEAKASDEWKDLECSGPNSGSSTDESKPLKCTWCSSRFMRPYEWERHEKTKYPQKGYVCPLCEDNAPIFKLLQGLKDHMSSIHHVENFENGETCCFQVRRSETYRCGSPSTVNPNILCVAEFTSWSERVEHIRAFHHPGSSTGSNGNGLEGGPGGGPGGPGGGSGVGPKSPNKGPTHRASGNPKGKKRPRTSYSSTGGNQAGDAEEATRCSPPSRELGAAPTKLLSLNHSQTLTLRSLNPLPFKSDGLLGSGGYGTVDKIRWDGTNEILARKTFHLSTGRRDFLREAEIMKELPQHAHIVTFLGSYLHDNQEFGILTSPVANYSLESYMEQHSLGDNDEKEKGQLYRWYSCLVAGLMSLHDVGIRHQDIKPANILISDGNIMFCDFGVSKSDRIPMTSGKGAMTKAYAPPEAARGELRGRASDIFSLGCIFLEIATLLSNRTPREFRKFRAAANPNKTPEDSYHDNLPAVMDWITLLSHHAPHSSVLRVLDVCRWMLSEDETSRPDIHQLADVFPPYPCCVSRPIRNQLACPFSKTTHMGCGTNHRRVMPVKLKEHLKAFHGTSPSEINIEPDEKHEPAYCWTCLFLDQHSDTWSRATQAASPAEVVKMSKLSMQASLREFDLQFSGTMSGVGPRSSSQGEFLRDQSLSQGETMQDDLDTLLGVETWSHLKQEQRLWAVNAFAGDWRRSLQYLGRLKKHGSRRLQMLGAMTKV